jgi:CRISPR-associated protein Cmr3
MKLKWWLIEPRDPLIVRDGRPFGPNPGARASSLEFPFPSTVVGGVRTRTGLDAQGEFVPDLATINAVKKVTVRGPLLARLAHDGSLADWLLPAPADALVAPSGVPEETPEAKPHAPYGKRRALTPRAAPTVTTNLPDGLLPVQLLTEPDPEKPETAIGKPESRAPRYWTWTHLHQWLAEAQDDVAPLSLSHLGSGGPMRERRTHVSVHLPTQTAQDGALFQTSGLEFQQRGERDSLADLERLALAVQVDTTQAQERSVVSGFAPLGGERRIVQWSDVKIPSSLDLVMPNEVQAKIIATSCCRVLLVTPAYFSAGYKPAFLCQPCEGVTPRLRAAAVRRSQVVSGWDFVLQTPKPTRRLAAAGSVYWLELDHDPQDAGAVERWVKTIWMHCISDDEESRNDGFGLALLGSWTHPTGEVQ